MHKLISLIRVLALCFYERIFNKLSNHVEVLQHYASENRSLGN